MTRATADQLGLVPGFALQDGDLLAKLLNEGNALGLGNTANGSLDLTGSGNNSIFDAFQIDSSITVLTVVTLTSNSVQLVPIEVASTLRIYNTTPNVAYVFPPEGQEIDGAPTNGAVWLSGGARCDYVYLGDGAWISDLLGTASA
jgi:hypothetical protein